MNPIDLARLQEFSTGAGEGLRDFATLFLSHMDELADSLRAALAAKDGAALRAEAHRGAGAAGACGAARLAALLRDLEELGAGHGLDEAATLVKQVEEELSRVRRFLDAALEAAARERPAAGTQE